jgi:Tol biopolymer transport system component
LERDLTVMLRNRAGADTRPPVTAVRVASRARRRRVINAVSVTAAVLLLMVGGTTALRSLGTDKVMPPPAVPITQHHNGALLIVGSNPGPLAVNPDGTTSRFRIARAPLLQGSWAPTWSPDGTRLAFLAGRLSLNSDNDTVALYVADADGSNVRKLTDCPEIYSCAVATGSGLSWSPDSRSIAITSGHLYVVDVADGDRRRLPGGELTLAPAWSPDGSVIAVGTRLGQDETWQVRTVHADANEDDNSSVTTLVDGMPGVDGLDWSPDATRLVLSAADGLHVVDANGNDALKIVSQDRGEGPGAATWSPDGTRIAYFTTPRVPDGFTAELHIVDPDSGHDEAMFVAPCCVSTWHPPAWSPDGTRIALSVEITGHPDQTGLFLLSTNGTGDAVRVPLNGMPGFPAWQPLP